MNKIILASKSKVRLKILKKNKIECIAEPSQIKEEPIKKKMIRNNKSPQNIARKLAEFKAKKVSLLHKDKIVLGADSLIDFKGRIISKPNDRSEALSILEKLNGNKHSLISAVCISKNGNVIWEYFEKAELSMKKFNKKELIDYLSKISDDKLYSYNVYQIEGLGKMLFDKISGDKNTIMGLPVRKIKSYLRVLK